MPDNVLSALSTPELDRLIAAAKAKPEGSGWRAACPVCQQGATSRPAMRIFEGASGWRVECFKGCRTDDILAQFGTTWATLNGRGGRDSVAPQHHVGNCKPVPFVPKASFATRHARYLAAITREQQEWLADHLGVSVDAVVDLQVGWDQYNNAYSIPELDAGGAVIGIQNRGRDDIKLQRVGTARGLAMLPGWQCPEPGGVVAILEGASDVLAAVSMGFRSAIGRSGNSAGADLLAEVLIDIPIDVTVIVGGENDRRHVDGHEKCEGCSACFPGLAGAVSVATKLAAHLERPICVAMPGHGAKDVRSWLIQTGLSFAEAGAVWLDSLTITTIDPPVEAAAETIEPAAIIEERSHEVRRPEMVTSRIESLLVPGDYVDRSSTGSGKTSTIVKAMEHGTKHILDFRALICMQTHEQCQEVQTELLKVGVVSACYSGRFTEDKVVGPDGEIMPANCWSLQADKAQEQGLSVASAVCKTCDHRHKCADEGHIFELNIAEAAQIALATHARAVFNTLPHLTANRSYSSVDENPLPVIRPTAEVSAAGIDAALAVVDDITNNPKWLNSLAEKIETAEPDAAAQAAEDDSEPSPYRRSKVEKDGRRDAWKGECSTFAAHMHAALTQLKVEMEGVKSIKEFTLKQTIRKPQAFEWLVFTAGKGMPHLRIDDPIWRPLLALVSGETHAAAIIGRESRTAGNANPEYTQTLVVTWSNTPRPDRVNWFDDATLDLPSLEMILGRPVRDMTPTGQAPAIKSAVQYTDIDITRAATPKHIKRLTRLIQSLMAFRPEARRIGLIVHQTHVRALKRLANTEPRIAKITHFGSGQDRSSNKWFVECDLLAIVGTPRVDKSQIRKRLFQIGDLAAAALEPQWVARQWQGWTESGKQVFVKNKGYDNPKWRAANDAIVRSALIQAVGRARITLDCGIPVVVFSSQECGLKVSDSCAGVVKSEGAEEKMLRVIARMQGVLANGSDVLAFGCDVKTGLTQPFANSIELANGCDARFSHRNQTLIPCTSISRELRVSAQAARKTLTRLESRRLVHRPAGSRGGWSLTDAGLTLAVQAMQSALKEKA